MAGLYSGTPRSSATLDLLGTDAIEASSGEVAGAVFGQAMADNPTAMLGRWVDRQTADGEMLPPDQANERYGIKGRLSFDKEVSEPVAKQLYDHHREELRREDIIARRGGGIVSSGLGRFAVGAAASLLDPIGIAASFIPVVGQARYAEMVGNAAGALGRAGVRAGVGALEGAAGAAALEPLHYVLAQQEQDHYTMADSLLNLAFGATMGAGLHVVGGGVKDAVTGRFRNPITERVEAAPPEARADALHGAVAAVAEGRPVEVARVFDLAEAREAEGDLMRWVGQQQRIAKEADDALAASLRGNAQTGARSAAAEAMRQRLDGLRAEADRFRSEISDAEARASIGSDPETAARIQAITAELAQDAIPATRRAALEDERRMLEEGRPTDADALEAARAEAEAAGLRRGLARTEQEAARLAGKVDRSVAGAETGAKAADGAFGIQSARIQSKEAVTQAMAERSIRQYAGSVGAQLEAGEAAALARRILGAPADRAQAEVRAVVEEVGKRRTRGTPVSEPAADADATVRQALAGMQDVQAKATADLVAAQARRFDAPDDAAAARENADLLARTAGPEGGSSGRAGQAPPDLTAAEATVKALVADIEREVKAGRLRDGDLAPLRAADELTEAAEAEARAYEAAAACMIARMA